MEENQTPPALDNPAAIAAAVQKKTADQRRKDRIMKNGEDIFNRYSRDAWPTGQWNYVKMREIGQYFLGLQDPRQYLSKWDRSIQNKGSQLRANQSAPWSNPSMEGITTGNLQILNHIVTTIMGNMSNVAYPITVFRMDGAANKLRQKLQDGIALAMELKSFGIRYQGLLDELGFKEEELPISDYDLRKKVENKRVADEVEMQYAVKDVLQQHNFWASIVERIRLNTILFGFTEVRTDWMAKRNRVRFTDLFFRISGFAQKPDCSDSPFDAELIFVPLSDLKYEAEGEITDWTSVEALATSYQDFFQRYSGYVMTRGSGWGPRMDGAVIEAEKGVPVLDFVYKQTDRIVDEERELPDGTVFRKRSLNKSGTNIVAEKAIEHRYGGKWIVGTKEMYQWGRILPSARQYDATEERDSVIDYYTCHSGFIGFRPMAMSGLNVPPAEKALNILNEIQQLWVKLSRINKRILPPLISADRKAFKDLIQDKGGKGLTPMDVATSIFGDGFNLWDSQPYAQNLSLPKGGPVSVQHTEDVRKAQEIVTLMAELMNMLREMMATPPQMNGVMPGTRTGEGVSELMVNQAQTTMLPFYKSVENVIERTCDYILMMIKYSGAEGNFGGNPYFIDASTEANTWRNVYKCRVKTTMNNERWNRLYEFLNRYIEMGYNIPPDVVFAIEDTDDVKEAEMLLADAVKRAEQTARGDAQYQFQMQEQQRKNAIADTTESKISIDKSKQLAKTQGDLILQNQKDNATLELQDKKTDDEIRVMKLDESMIEQIAKKVLALNAEKQKSENKS